MQINQYTIYSLISTTESINNEEFEKVLTLVEDLSKINTIEKAKEILNRDYQIDSSVVEFSLGANSFLNIKETENKYSVRISYRNNNENKNVIYCYKK